MKLTLMVLCLWAFTAATASSEQGVPFAVIGSNVYLLPLSRSGHELEDAKKGAKKPLFCGPYFVIPDGVDFPGRGKAATVHFEVGAYPTSEDPQFLSTDRNEFLVMIEERESPMMTMIGPLGNDPLPHHWVLRISKSDHEAAKKCIPPENYFPRPTT